MAHPTTEESCTTASSSSSSNPLVNLALSIREYFLTTLTAHPFVSTSVSKINTVLLYVNVPEKSLITHEEFVLSSTAVVVTLIIYYVLFGKRHRRKRRVLAEELRVAQRQVHILEEKLFHAKIEDIKMASTPTRKNSFRSSNTQNPQEPRQIRIFMDGAFDVMHYGHMNAFRLGRSLGTYLIVGVNSDESITQCKGPPLMNDEERMTMVKGCKFVDEVVPNCPYIMTSDYLDYIFETYDVDYVVHGDDPCIVDGKDVYASAKRLGRYRSIPRTEGVSTTEIVGRMLLMTKHHHLRHKQRQRGRGNSVGSLSGLSITGGGVMEDGNSSDDSDNEIHHDEEEDELSVFTASQYNDGERIVIGNQSKFLTTSMMLRLFSAGVKPPEEGMRVIYVDGAFDMFHCGHVRFLEEAAKRGDYLIVGIHGDSLVNKRRGSNLPLMNLHERVLSVLGCKYVNDVLIDAPLAITHEMIASLKISEVIHGTETDDVGAKDDRYQCPRELGILSVIKSPIDFKLVNILSRIQRKQAELQRKIERKKKAEKEWFNNKYDPKNGTK